MGDEVAALRAQLEERDAKILEVKEKAKQFVRERMAASATAIESYKSESAQQAATITELRARLADAEAVENVGSTAGAPDGPDTESAALVAQLRAEVRERDAKVNEVKEKAKVFVRDKLKSVQEAVKEMEVRHEQFVGALAAVVPPPDSGTHGSPLPDTNPDGQPSALTKEERALLGSACCLLSTSRTPPALQPDTSESDAELSRL
eukprot:COSAG02_NODE_20976_length_807_cov_2.040960_1_plen_205_part_01